MQFFCLSLNILSILSVVCTLLWIPLLLLMFVPYNDYQSFCFTLIYFRILVQSENSCLTGRHRNSVSCTEQYIPAAGWAFIALKTPWALREFWSRHGAQGLTLFLSHLNIAYYTFKLASCFTGSGNKAWEKVYHYCKMEEAILSLMCWAMPVKWLCLHSYVLIPEMLRGKMSDVSEPWSSNTLSRRIHFPLMPLSHLPLTLCVYSLIPRSWLLSTSWHPVISVY